MLGVMCKGNQKAGGNRVFLVTGLQLLKNRRK
jgi:hypothetical protein